MSKILVFHDFPPVFTFELVDVDSQSSPDKRGYFDIIQAINGDRISVVRFFKDDERNTEEFVLCYYAGWIDCFNRYFKR